MNIDANQVMRWARTGLRLARQIQRARQSGGTGPATRTVPGSGRGSRSPEAAARGATYPGDYRGPLSPVYSPAPDGAPDPGEIVWTWVPYEEDHSRGKDRPVLLVGRDGGHLLALMLTSKDRSSATEHDPDYLDIGTGDWDRQGRPSEVKLDRVIRVDPQSIRREGAVLPRDRFQEVARRLRERG